MAERREDSGSRTCAAHLPGHLQGLSGRPIRVPCSVQILEFGVHKVGVQNLAALVCFVICSTPFVATDAVVILTTPNECHHFSFDPSTVEHLSA